MAAQDAVTTETLLFMNPPNKKKTYKCGGRYPGKPDLAITIAWIDGWYINVAGMSYEFKRNGMFAELYGDYWWSKQWVAK
jgi:hypothetical protein